MKKIFWLMLGFIFLLGSCEKNSLDEEREYENFQEDVTLAEQNPIEGESLIINYDGRELEVTEAGGAYLFEGDILIPKQEGKSSIRNSGLWENNIVPYVIASDLLNPDRVVQAMKHWEEKTNIRFVPRTSDHLDYVMFVNGSGCSSYVGKTGYRQYITLSQYCSVGNTIHEIGHAVGLWHEQSRQDRDEYVKIWWENIKVGYEHNFNKWSKSSTDVGTFDFGSVMMYSPYSFSSNQTPTITKLDGSLYSFQRVGLSVGDIEGVYLKYPGLVTPEPTPEPEPTPVIVVPEPEPEPVVIPTPEPTVYVNGQWYVISGKSVLYDNGKWYIMQGKTLVEVELINGVWEKIRTKPEKPSKPNNGRKK